MARRVMDQQWREEDRVIYLEVTSDGTTGPQWVKRLERELFQISDNAKTMLCGSDFNPTSGVTYRVAILKGMLFVNEDRITSRIWAEANRRNLEEPNAEVACLIREKFRNRDLKNMGLWQIVVFQDSLNLLVVRRSNESSWLNTLSHNGPDEFWSFGFGFAFALP